MIPDLVAYEQGEINWCDTQYPLSAWAVNFGKFMYNIIDVYHAWWYTNRDGDHISVNEYEETIFDRSGGWFNNSKQTITTVVA